ncbi:MAG: hypothetical protein MJ048_05000 [Acidaminococcaceae bacterium]|nr:hypothetical protein [Acidaminococcaceae bacterium]
MLEEVSGVRYQVRGKVSIVGTFSAPGVGRGTSDSFSVAGGGVARYDKNKDQIIKDQRTNMVRCSCDYGKS